MRFILPIIALFLFVQPSIAAESFRVDKVLDGNSLLLSSGKIVRLIGIDAPTQEATDFLKLLVEGKGVRLEYDKVNEDEEGHLLAYVLMIETMINATIVHAGFATPQSMPPNTTNDPLFDILYQDALKQKRGLWNKSK